MIVDADSHIIEPDDLYVRFARPGSEQFILTRPEYGLLEAAAPLGGMVARTPPVRPTLCAAEPGGEHDPERRLVDMAREGIDAMVCFPSVVSSLCRYPVDIEVAMVGAYNDWMTQFCGGAAGRLFAPIVTTLRDIDMALAELERCGDRTHVVGVTVHTRSLERNLDDPYFYPLWAAAEAADLPILVHAGTARPPYPLGIDHQGDNFFVMHLMHHPTEQMLAMATLFGGGVMERFARLRCAFFEAGCGWVPWYLERIAEHWELLPDFVPAMHTHPLELLRDGRCFFSCDPGEVSIPYFVDCLGADSLLYASDYPHWDSAFPESVSLLAKHPKLDQASRAAILGGNALSLYPRIPR